MKYYLIILLMTPLTACKGQDTSFVADQVQQSAEITLQGPVAKVFPLFGIIREKEWDPEWNPTPVFPKSGDITEGAIYRTPGHVPGEAPLTWIVARYDTSLNRVTYIVTASDRIVSIDIQCKSDNDQHTRARVTYTLTSLTPTGNIIIKHLLAAIFDHNLQGWQTAINQVLKRTP
jgi:hypothetical protein